MMVIPCLCLSRFSSCTATTKKVPRPKGLAASFLIDIPTHWEHYDSFSMLTGLSIPYSLTKDHCYMSELSLFPAYVRTDIRSD